MDVGEIISRIAKGRNQKGYTYENMGQELNISGAGYRKIETGQTPLTVERLLAISNYLDMPIEEIFDLKPSSQNQHNNDGQEGNVAFNQKIENFYQESREMTEHLLKAKDEVIATKNQLIENLQKELEALKTATEI
ncbi:helix-turn-helix domain-containing protein [Cruoricaptor ignavus]|uniref:helix-turn-helix domain-containing protein n=1 Tax=Cruoricaptor ignavus TaxID=1118202 RepID=UPI00370D1FB2